MRTLAVLSVMFFSVTMFAQPTESAADYQKQYNRRIKKEILNNVYIPIDLGEAMSELKQLSEPAAIRKFGAAEEDFVVERLYPTLGRWIIHNWGFHGGSRLSHWIKTNTGLSHPEDMAVFILRMFHRNLNKKSLEVKEVVTKLKAARKTKVDATRTIKKIGTRKVERPKE